MKRRRRRTRSRTRRRRWRQGPLGGPASSGNDRHWAAGAPIPSCSPRPPGAQGTGWGHRTAPCRSGTHNYGSGKNRARGLCPQPHHQHLPQASPGRHSLCPYGPGRRKVDGTAATRPPDQRAAWGQGGAACHGQAGEPRGPQPTTTGFPGSPEGQPPRMGSRARVATK